MSRIHIMLQVRDLDRSIDFYSTLFDHQPTLRKDDYAKWLLEDPRVNFSIAPSKGSVGIEHLGLQADTAEELEALRGRIDRAGGTVETEGETVCCYHHSDKTWVTDEQDVSWEAFYTSGEASTYHAPEAEGRADGCCSSTCCDGDNTDSPAP